MRQLKITTIFLSLIFLIVCSLNVSAVWYNTSFPSCINVTINNPTGETLTDFPVLLNITKAASMQADFDDLRITNVSCNNAGTAGLLSAELDNYTATNAYIWAKTTLSSGNNVIGVYYGNSSVSNAWDGVNTWNSGYQVVYHMSGTKDSTSNSWNISNDEGAQASTGIIGGGYYINGSQSFAAPNNNSVFYSTPQTIELYVNFVSVGTGTSQIIYGVRNSSSAVYAEQLYATSSTKLFTNQIANSTGTSRTASGALVQANSTWYMAGAWINSTRNEVLANGAIDGTGITYTGGMFSSSVMRAPRFGASGTGGSLYMKGYLDEFRLSNVQRSLNWINFSYLSITANPTYYTYSSEINSTTNPCTYSGSGNMTITSSTCNITSNINMLGNKLFIVNSTVRVLANVTNCTGVKVNANGGSARLTIIAPNRVSRR